MKRTTATNMIALRASGSSTNLPAYCLASIVADDSPQMVRSKTICFQSAFEASDDTGEEDGSDDFIHQPGKKRRLSLQQVRTLEKSFELENKLEPERKIQIANELGLQPRQVAVWFQNRRARWKTKKLEKDYDCLKTDYVSLKGKYDVLLKEKEEIQAEMMRLKDRLQLANNETKGREDLEPVELNGTLTTLHSQLVEEEEAQGNPELDASMEDQPVQSLLQNQGSPMSDADASEISNTSNPSSPKNKVFKSTHDHAAAAATCFLISNLNSKHQATVLPSPFSESLSLLKKVQAATVKIEPENMQCETACCNFIVETDEEGAIPWWDWDYCNFCT